MMLAGQLQNRLQQDGFSLLETLMAATLMVLLLVPALQSLATFSRVSTELGLHANRIQSMQEKMDELLAMDFASLADEAAAHDAPNYTLSDPAGVSARRMVFVSHYDGDVSGSAFNPFVVADKDADLIWIDITVDGVQDHLSTLVRRP